VRTGRARADADRLTLDVACNEMDARHSYQHCYWGGAALTALLADDVGTDAVMALVRALHDSAPLDATPRSARELLHRVAIEATDAVAADAARRLWALWERFRHEPFPDVAGLLARAQHAG
jgi:hypothetical protein